MIRPAREERLLVWLLLPVLMSALVTGGSAWPRHVGDGLTAIFAVPLVVYLAFTLRLEPGRSVSTWLEVVLPIGTVSLLLLQLVPLPPSIWSLFPSHVDIVAIDDILGRPSVAMPLSLTPAGTLGAVAYLVPLFAVFFAVRSMGREARRLLVVIVIAMAIANALLALAQGAFGPQSVWNIYGTASTFTSTGLFRSQNHYVALQYAAIPFVFALAVDFHHERHCGRLAIFLLGTAVVALLFLGGLLSHSRSGMIGTVLASPVSAVVFLVPARRDGARGIPGWVLLVPLLLLLAAFDREFARIRQRVEENPIDDLRGTIYATTYDAIWANWPWGTGFGSFVDVYEKYEAANRAVYAFINFAHDDYLQILLEGGVFGAILIGGFCVWMIIRGVALVRRRTSGNEIDPSTVASLISMSLLLFHSLVDYPLRTGAIACVFAIACAHLARSPTTGPSPRRTSEGKRDNREFHDADTVVARHPAATGVST